jgi:putative transposase
MVAAVQELAPVVGRAEACRCLGVPRASLYRRLNPRPAGPRPPRPAPDRTLSSEERRQVLDVLHSERFVDQAPAAVFYALLDEGVYLCSIRTMYRILREHEEVRERRDQLRHPNYRKPELLATGPNQVWSWDITKLLGPVKWTYYYLYVILDIFSRYVVGWMVAHRESADLARRLIAESCAKQGIRPGQLTIHADRGTAMKAKLVAQLLADLGVTKTHCRPYTSSDNPFSESHFKTLKYRPEFPDRFGSYEEARAFGAVFFPWYNEEHYHSGLAYLTPAAVHYHRANEILEARQKRLLEVYTAHPERFPNGPPRVPELPEAVWINPPEEERCVPTPTPTVDTPPEDSTHHSGDQGPLPNPPTRGAMSPASLPNRNVTKPRGSAP